MRHDAATASRADSDTTLLARSRYLDLLAGLTPAERLERAMALSAFVRQVAWAGAQQAVGDRGPVAVRDRFLAQLYGPDMSENLRVLISRL